MNFVDSTESWKKNPTKYSSKLLPSLGSEPRASDFTALCATISANSPICWMSQPFRSLYSHTLLIPKHFLSPRINRAWIYKDLLVWDFRQTGELGRIVACRAVKSEALGSLPSEGNIFPQDFFFVLSWFCRIHRMHLYFGKTPIFFNIPYPIDSIFGAKLKAENLYEFLIWHKEIFGTTLNMVIKLNFLGHQPTTRLRSIDSISGYYDEHYDGSENFWYILNV